MNMQMLNRYLRPLKERVAMMLSKGMVEGVKDTTQMQLVKVSLHDDELQESVEHVHEYGFSSNCPTDGAEAVIGCIGGNRDSAIAITVGNSKLRVKSLQSGEVVIYSKFGQTILLKSDGTIQITPASGQRTEINSDLAVKGNITATMEITAMTLVPASSVKTSKHLHGTGTGPSSPPTPGT